MWLLNLNHMRGRCEILQTVAWAETKEELIDFIIREKALEPWFTTTSHMGMDDYKFIHYFKKGSVLEWYNLPHEFDDRTFYNYGTQEEAIERTIDMYENIKNIYHKAC